MLSPFSPEAIQRILERLSETSVADVDDRELSVEFKESFNKAGIPEYGRTMAGFANAQGGYLVFGVRNEPREIVGLCNDQFFTLDPAITTNNLNEYFEPALPWKHHDIDVEGKRLGLIYVAEANRKPAICRKHKDRDLREGAIYYRYQGRTQEIRPAELRQIMDAERQKVHDQWLETLSKIATVGLSQVGILDLNTGEVSGAKGSFFIDEQLLPKLRFIQEGRFVETGGEPALRLMGDLRPVGAAAVQPTHTIKIPQVICGVDLLMAFLKQDPVEEPMQWVKAICNEQSANFPVHYFLSQAKASVAEATVAVEDVITREVGKGRLLKALREGRRYQKPKLDGDTEKAELRRELLGKLRAQTLTAQEVSSNFDRAMEAVLYLRRDSTDLPFVLDLLRTVGLPRYSNMNGNQATRFRSAVCHLDEEWFGPRSEQHSLLEELVVCPGELLDPVLTTSTALRV
ncbi:MAG: ATP-binding protein [Bryobacterales bacterium]|nr:ATP-binding protein [Bryobacterales bacterium]